MFRVILREDRLSEAIDVKREESEGNAISLADYYGNKGYFVTVIDDKEDNNIAYINNSGTKISPMAESNLQYLVEQIHVLASKLKQIGVQHQLMFFSVGDEYKDKSKHYICIANENFILKLPGSADYKVFKVSTKNNFVIDEEERKIVKEFFNLSYSFLEWLGLKAEVNKITIHDMHKVSAGNVRQEVTPDGLDLYFF